MTFAPGEARGWRLSMVREQLVARGIWQEDLLEAMERVPRHRFVPGDLCRAAYEDRPLPIGHGQTISQPFVVALMTQLLNVGRGDRVLEIGAGSGYQTSILLELGADLWSVERDPSLAATARLRLSELGFENVRLHVRDGSLGVPEAAPFAGILVAAAPEDVPEALLDQLAPGGRLVIPVGPKARQTLLRITKDPQGFFQKERLGAVAFVPLVPGFEAPVRETRDGPR